MSNNKQSASINIVWLFTLAFVILKLCHVIDWSWWWVFAPIWGYVAIIAILCIVALLLPSKKPTTSPKPRISTWEERMDEILKRQKAKSSGDSRFL